MFVVAGITGQVGGFVAQTLLDAGLPVRAVVRDAAKGKVWQARGCQVVIADVGDEAALTRAFSGADAVFIMLPSNFAPAEGFPEVRTIAATLSGALKAANPGKVVCLSTVGAQATQPNLLNQLQIAEQVLGALPMPVAFVRAAWFMENSAWDIEPARLAGLIPSYLQPLDKPVPMVSVADVGRVGAQVLQQEWRGVKVVELEGPRRYTPNDIATAFSRILGKYVSMFAVPKNTWAEVFIEQGSTRPEPRIQMLNGFNEGWIEFEGGQGASLKGTVTLEQALARLVANAG
ncbi:NmrA family NAD(P)-binding protein [Janthinobacterium agaricidamnosum]|uniref:TrkA-N domain protein n=1 Tax=Janthinobacterium agaricidamnosum NBRC 102515 = DSM 9628 TaxID=1349767 RepID=W0V4V9_9BURK|nr:NmrA family NAD(P)-binding protein [Janthinobacterium agaricidamnosum]CDG82630.1 trkA-N domain protein [Janthinobacterium agaricidamnosum NBRC 102515 = DSM 9628]